MSDPGDEDPTQRQDREIVETETRARSDRLFDLAEQCDNDAMREQAIESLEGVKRAHEPPPPEPWVRRL